MKIVTLVPAAAFVVFTGSAFAQDSGVGVAEDTVVEKTTSTSEYPAEAHPDFAAADTDKDGLLSIAEIQAALPDVDITDENADGFVNQSEAESAIAGLAYESNGYTGGSSLVSEAEYGLIVASLEEEANTGAGTGIVDDATDGAEGAGVETQD